MTGREGAKKFMMEQKGNLGKLHRWLIEFWRKLKDFFDFVTSLGTKKLTLNEFINMPLDELVNRNKLGDEYRMVYGEDDYDNNSGIKSSFRHPFKTLAKKFGVNSDKIITDEDMKARQRENQIEAMDAFLKNPGDLEAIAKLKELKVTKGMLNAYKNGEEYITELGVQDTIRRSPSTIAEKVPIFRAFYRMAERAMKKLILSRDSYGRKLANIFKELSKDDMKTLNDLLVAGDAERVDYSELSREERDALGGNAGHKEYDKARVDKIVKEQGVNKDVARAFVKIRQLITKMANEIDNARRKAQSVSKWLTDKEIEDLKNNKFVIEVRKIGDHETKNGKRLVSWKEYKHFEPEKPYTIDEATLDRFERDDSIQVLSKRKLPDGMYEVKTREQLGRINRIQSYIPHLYHEYMIRVVGKDGKPVDKYGYGGVINSGQTQRDAVKIAEEWLKNNQLADGEEIYIAPKMANFGKEFEDAYAPIMGDKDYDTMVHKIAENNGIKLKDAKEFVKDSVRLRNRHRFFGNLLKRQGANGYITDMQYVLRHYFNSGARYVALETEFKPQAISLFERVFGAFGDDWSGNSLAKYTKNYINDVNGNPTHIETVLNKALNSNVLFRKFITPIWGERASITLAADINSLVAYAKLGVFNVSSALLNYTQLINAGGYLGGYSRLMKHAARLVNHKLTQNEIRILAEAGTLQDIGLDTSTSYDKSRGYGNLLMRFGDKSMYLFKKADMHCRIATTFAAYEKALADGKSRREAIAFAKEVNRKANFSYGIEDAPNMFRRTGPIGKIALQFQKYPVKQLEVMADMLSSKTTKAQKAAFWLPYFFAVGLMGFIPAGGWLDDLVKKLSGYSPKDLVQEYMMEKSAQNKYGKEFVKILMYGLGAAVNIDTSKRAGLTDLMPQDFTSFIIGPAGSTIRNTFNYATDGEYANALRSVSPGMYNIYAAIEGETTGKRGRKTTVYEDAWDKIIRGIGFKSVDESVDVDTKRILNNEQTRYNKERQEVIDALVENPYDKDAQKLARKYNVIRDDVISERNKKRQTYRERTENAMSKRQRKEYQYLIDFAK